MKFKLISMDGPEYEAERLLRWEVLAKPNGMPPGTEILPEENQSLHLAAFDKKRLVGCICFHPESTHRARVFEMAVSEEYQGKGFGRKLLHALEEMLIKRGISDVYLYAKEDSEEFYLLMGYQPEGEFIVQMGQKQRMMRKKLQKIGTIDQHG